MLDFSNTHYFREFLNEMIDESLEHENAARAPRDYLGGSRVGHAC
jgi:hypothetical protein